MFNLIDVSTIWQNASSQNYYDYWATQSRMQAVTEQIFNNSLNMISVSVFKPQTIKNYSNKQKAQKEEAIKQQVEAKKQAQKDTYNKIKKAAQNRKSSIYESLNNKFRYNNINNSENESNSENSKENKTSKSEKANRLEKLKSLVASKQKKINAKAQEAKATLKENGKQIKNSKAAERSNAKQNVALYRAAMAVNMMGGNANFYG